MSLYLSKSRFCSAYQCPKMLWLKQNKPEEFNDDVMDQSVLNTGSAVGDFAMALFGPFVEVPFGDLKFVRYVMSIDPELKLNKYNMGKYLLRHAFEKDRILPEEILFRDKAAFSDAVGHSLVEILKEYAEENYSDEEFEDKRKKYVYRQPYTKESLLYREIFEQYYPDMAKLIIDYWLPNQKWEGCKVSDPSARYLSNYGRSGE